MPRPLLDALRAAVDRHAMLAKGDLVLVGVSGGVDSVALLTALVELQATLGIRVAAAHLDHGLRGIESADDAAFVEALGARLGVAVHGERTTLVGNLEAAGRRARYAFFARVADAIGATRIATAHTRDDQAETVLLRLLHGTGRRGLGGIHPRRGRLIRPLILCEREQARRFLVDRGISWRRDRSNFDLGFARNRVRHAWLPGLARDLNPRLAEGLARLADVLREEDRLLDRLARMPGARGPQLDLTMLRVLDPPLARRAVRRWWDRHGSGRRLGFAHVEAALALVDRAAGGGEVAVPGGALVRSGTMLVFRASGAPGEAPAWTHALVPGVPITTPEGWHLDVTECPAGQAGTAGPATCLLDAAAAAADLVVRPRRPGDRLRLHGLGGRTSVKRLLIARGVPRQERAAHPIVLLGDEILWVPGCGRSDRGLVTASTARILVIRAVRSASPTAPEASS